LALPREVLQANGFKDLAVSLGKITPIELQRVFAAAPKHSERRTRPHAGAAGERAIKKTIAAYRNASATN